MNYTKHFNKRWVERILGITTDAEQKEYISLNIDQIKEHASKTFEYAEFIYKGAIGDNVTRNYYIQNDIIFVTNVTDDAMITVYKVDLGYTEELNTTVRKGLIKEIHRLSSEKEEVELQILQELEDKEHAAETMNDQIKIMEEQLSNMKKQHSFITQEIKNSKSKSLNVGLELRKFTMLLVNSKSYKEDIMSFK